MRKHRSKTKWSYFYRKIEFRNQNQNILRNIFVQYFYGLKREKTEISSLRSNNNQIEESKWSSLHQKSFRQNHQKTFFWKWNSAFQKRIFSTTTVILKRDSPKMHTQGLQFSILLGRNRHPSSRCPFRQNQWLSKMVL